MTMRKHFAQCKWMGVGVAAAAGIALTISFCEGIQAADSVEIPPEFQLAPGLPDWIKRGHELANQFEFGGAARAEFEANVAPNLPDKPAVPPSQPRKVLLHHNPRHLRHNSETLLRWAIRDMGAKTGAFAVTVSNDFDDLSPEKLAGFDALAITISVGYPAEKLPAVLDFVRNGGGLVLVHSSVDAFIGQKDFQALAGGTFLAHPFEGKELVLRNETTGNPLTAMWPESFPYKDEIFHFGPPYSRERMTVLLSIDYANSPEAQAISKVKREEGKAWDLRDDNDYAVSWLRREGKGRVFFTSPTFADGKT